MGKQIFKSENVQALFNEIREQISDRFFELGPDQEILANIKSNFDNLYELMSGFDSYYATLPFKDRAGFYEAKRITADIKTFLDSVRESAVGDVNKTRRLREYVRELENTFETSGMATGITGLAVEMVTPVAANVPGSAIEAIQNSHKNQPVVKRSEQVVKPRTRRWREFTDRFSTKAITPLGSLFFDIMGRKPESLSSPIIIGWLLFISVLVVVVIGIVLVVLFLKGTITIEHLIRMRQFLFPPKVP